MIPRSFIQQLVGLCEIEDVVSSYVTIRRAGRNPKGLCPFHSEKTPSFVLYPDNQSFYCFGCGAGGDVISFIMRAENLDYVEAVRFLAKRVGLEVPDEGEDSSGQLKARILEINRETARFFYQCLKSPAGRPGMEYLREKRGLSMKTITSYGLGYAPDSWDSLLRHLHGKGFRDEEMAAACVAAKGRNGRYYDQFRNRVMFPIIDLRGNVIAFGGRVLDDSKPKYLNSPDTPVFKKSRNLFALNFAKASKRKGLLLCEGYMDVIAVHQAGFDNAVATLGTALTGEQARLIAQYTDQVTIAYDSDGAGQTATRRAVGLLAETGVKIRVLTMSGAKDPDEYIKTFGAERFSLLIENASNATEFEIAKLRQRYPVETADGKVSFLREFVKLMTGVSNPIERDVYIAKTASELEVDKTAITTQLNYELKRAARKGKRREASELKVYSEARGPTYGAVDLQRSRNIKYALAEDKLLAILMKNPDYYRHIAGQIQIGDFVTDRNRELAQVLFDRLENGQSVELTMLSAVLSIDQMGIAAELLNSISGMAFDPADADAYIETILSYREQKSQDEVAAMSDDDLMAYITSLASKKNRGTKN